MVKISVISPIYNVEKYMDRYFNSILNQTLKDIEIICIDDGSTDKSLEIIKDAAKKDSRIKVIAQENRGPGVARNQGLKIAQGEYIGFLDPDDWVDLNFYEELYNIAKSEDYDLVKGSSETVFSNGKVEKHYINNEIEEELKTEKVPFKTFQAWWSAIYKKEILDKFDIWFADSFCCEDVAFFFKYLFITKSFSYTNNVFYHYFKRYGSLTNTTDITRTSKVKAVLISERDMVEFFNQQNMSEEFYKFFINNKYLPHLKDMVLMATYLKKNEYIDAISALSEQVNSLKYNVDDGSEVIKYLKANDYKSIKKLYKKKFDFLKNIFAVQNDYHNDKKYKALIIFSKRIPLRFLGGFKNKVR